MTDAEILAALQEQAILAGKTTKPPRQATVEARKVRDRVWLHTLSCGHRAILTGINRPVRLVACYGCAKPKPPEQLSLIT